MTATTLTTVGFGEINAPLSPEGRWFTLSLMAFGIGAVFVLIGSFTAVLATGELGYKMKRRKMRRRIDDLDGHYIICAYGRVGRSAAEELIRQGAEVVVIDVKEDLEPLMQEDDVPYIIGDPADDDVLEAAGLHRAKALICAVDSDEVNVYITLSARSLNPGLFIVSRASRPESIDKLERAGSNRVVSPYGLSGIRMASLSMQPAMIEFVDMISVAPDLRIEELRVGATSPYVGRSVKDVCAPYDGDHPAGPAPVGRRRAHPAEGRQRAGRGRRGDRGGTGLGAHRTGCRGLVRRAGGPGLADALLDLARLDARRADRDAPGAAGDDRPHALDVGVPAALVAAVGVAHAHPERRVLATDLADGSHRRQATAGQPRARPGVYDPADGDARPARRRAPAGQRRQLP